MLRRNRKNRGTKEVLLLFVQYESNEQRSKEGEEEQIQKKKKKHPLFQQINHNKKKKKGKRRPWRRSFLVLSEALQLSAIHMRQWSTCALPRNHCTAARTVGTDKLTELRRSQIPAPVAKHCLFGFRFNFVLLRSLTNEELDGCRGS